MLFRGLVPTGLEMVAASRPSNADVTSHTDRIAALSGAPAAPARRVVAGAAERLGASTGTINTRQRLHPVPLSSVATLPFAAAAAVAVISCRDDDVVKLLKLLLLLMLLLIFRRSVAHQPTPNHCQTRATESAQLEKAGEPDRPPIRAMRFKSEVVSLG
jgi:hypothetical protein